MHVNSQRRSCENAGLSKLDGIITIWVCNLIITLYSYSSWAVNELCEVEMANLYYFTWAVAVNGDLLFASYLKKKFNVKSKDVMVRDLRSNYDTFLDSMLIFMSYVLFFPFNIRLWYV